MNINWNILLSGAAVLGFAVLHTLGLHGTARAADLRQSAWLIAEWALARENPTALADSITLYLDEGGNLDQGDPFSALAMIEALRAMPGGAALAEEIVATRARGQFGGASRIDILLAPQSEHVADLRLVGGEVSWIEARLWQGSQGANIDLEMHDADGNLLGEDLAEDTGVEGVAALLEVWADACVDARLRIANSGAAPGRVAILIPQSARANCEDPG